MGRRREPPPLRWLGASPRRAGLAALAVASVAAALQCTPFESADDGGGDGGATDPSTLDAAPGGEARRPVPNGNYEIYVSNETLNGAEASGYRCEPPAGDAGPRSVKYVPLLRTLSRPSIDFFIEPSSTYSLVDGTVLGSGAQIGGTGPGTAPKLGRDGQDMSGSDSGGAWTGFGPNGEPAADCEGWTASASGTGQTGRFLSAGTQWLAAGLAACAQRRHVYCVQIE